MSEMSYLERVARGLAKVSHVPAQVLPATMAVMHGASFAGDCASELRGLAGVMKAVLGPPAASFGTL